MVRCMYCPKVMRSDNLKNHTKTHRVVLIASFQINIAMKNTNNEYISRKNTNKRKKLFDDDTDFPTVKDMLTAEAIAFSKLEIDEVYQILNAEKKSIKYHGGEEIECAFLTLKRKNNPDLLTVRATQTVYRTLYNEHDYEKHNKTQKFYIMYKGEKMSANQKNYCDFVIKKV